jgi:hypothetical protein
VAFLAARPQDKFEIYMPGSSLIVYRRTVEAILILFESYLSSRYQVDTSSIAPSMPFTVTATMPFTVTAKDLQMLQCPTKEI